MATSSTCASSPDDRRTNDQDHCNRARHALHAGRLQHHQGRRAGPAEGRPDDRGRSEQGEEIMDKFTVHKGIVAPIDRENVDTDAIIPKQFLKSIRKTGFGENLFDEWRFTDPGWVGKPPAE